MNRDRWLQVWFGLPTLVYDNIEAYVFQGYLAVECENTGQNKPLQESLVQVVSNLWPFYMQFPCPPLAFTVTRFAWRREVWGPWRAKVSDHWCQEYLENISPSGNVLCSTVFTMMTCHVGCMPNKLDFGNLPLLEFSWKLPCFGVSLM